MEPNILGKSAILSPSSGILDSYDFMQKLLNIFLENEGIFAGSTPFIDAEYSHNNSMWKVEIGGKDGFPETNRQKKQLKQIQQKKINRKKD